MPDWERYVRSRLRLPRLSEADASQVVSELAAMLGECEAEALAEGATAEAARRRAEAQVPDWHGLGREVQASRPVGLAGRRVRNWGGDVRAAMRRLRQRPLASGIAIATLALGIGAGTAIFTVVDTVLLTPLPYPSPDRLVRLWSTNPVSLETTGVSSGDVVKWRRRNQALEGIAGWYVMGRTLRGEGGSEVLNVAQVSRDFFPVLGTRALLGRTFTSEETARARFNTAAAPVGPDPVVVISHATWQRRFGADPGIVGRTVSLERLDWQVVGVMPASFAMPNAAVEMWIPWSFQDKRPHDQRYLGAVGRLERGVTLSEAEAQMGAIARALGAELPGSNKGWGVRLVPLREEIVAPTRTLLWLVLGAVGCVLLVACLNIANLQLVSLEERRREIAVRTALGASVADLVRHVMLENSAMALIGGVVAFPLAWFGIEALGSLGPAGLPRIAELAPDARVLAVAFGLTTFAGLTIGLIPAWVATSADLTAALQSGGRSAGSSPLWRRFRSSLVTLEIALAVVLLAAAALLVRSFDGLRAVDPGFSAEHTLVFPITLDNNAYDSGAKSREYYRRLIEKLEDLPLVVSAGGATVLPMSPIGPDFDRPIWADGELPPEGGARRADVRMATPGYFETLGMTLSKGRGFSNEVDTPTSPKVVIVNESLARRIWPDENPVGERLVIDYSTSGTYPYEVVGVVRDVRYYGLRTGARAELYLPHAQRSYLIMNVAVRTVGEPERSIAGVRNALLEVDPYQPAHSITPLSRLVSKSVSRERFAMQLIGGFAAVTLVLALLGVFGVVAHEVGHRVQEIGVRTALGASPSRVVRLIVSSGMRLAILGIAMGTLLGLGTTRILSGLLYEVSPVDPVTFASVAAAVGFAALLASVFPARRAARIDPAVALRLE